MSLKTEEIDGDEEEREYIVVPPSERLDHDDDGSDDTDAIDDETGTDQEAIDQARVTDGPLWEGE